MEDDPKSLATAHAAQIQPFFSQQLVTWQESHGRHHLPWQETRDPYRVWLSEIMLQQTQVATVLEYYRRFLERFPDVNALSGASQDEVLGLWSGLGYYSRARNLHDCAKAIVSVHGGAFPPTARELAMLPGIGPSTAAAIASFCFSERVAILDGNVKRVLTRVLSFAGDLAEGRQTKLLWTLATGLLPVNDLEEAMPRYTQGMMDLGATLCTRRKPQCQRCPVQGLCHGFAGGEPEKYPVKSRRLVRSSQSLTLLWAQRPDGSVWLERRPGAGIWGGLYCLPVFESEEVLMVTLPKHLQARVEVLATVLHALTHKDLYLTPVWAGFQDGDDMPLLAAAPAISESQNIGAWFAPDAWPALGLPAPIRKMLLNDAPEQRNLSLNF